MKVSRRQQEINARKAADPIAQAVGRDDVDYSSDDLPTAPRMTAAQALDRLDKDLADGVAAMIETAGGVGRERTCPHCHKLISNSLWSQGYLKDDECSGWHPEFKCECGFEAGSYAIEYRFCPMCGEARPTRTEC